MCFSTDNAQMFDVSTSFYLIYLFKCVNNNANHNIYRGNKFDNVIIMFLEKNFDTFLWRYESYMNINHNRNESWSIK